ncbi:MAG: PilZ domain-containing protein [Desulfobaccales bacterium]
MAAKFVDALKGYEYFLENRGKTSLDSVNHFLKSKDRSPISQRTYSHYKKLIKRGIMSYVPINQFDVDITLGRLQMATDRRRYPREIVHFDAWVSSDGTEWIKAKVINKSVVGFGLDTENSFPFKLKSLIWVRIDNYNDIPGFLVWKRREENGTRFGFRALEFIVKYQTSEEIMLIDRLKGQLFVRKTSGAIISWQELLRIMAKIDEMIGASSDLLDTLAKVSDLDLKITKPVLSSIKFSSPGQVVINIDIALAFLILGLLKTIQLWRPMINRFKEVTRTIELKNDILEIEKARKIIKLTKETNDSNINKQIVDNLSPFIKRALNNENLPSNMFEPNSPENGILNSRLIPAALDLAIGDDPVDIKVKAEESLSEKSSKK